METQNTAEEENNPGDGGSEEDEEGGKNENEGAGIHCVSKFVPPPRPMCFIGGGGVLFCLYKIRVLNNSANGNTTGKCWEGGMLKSC